MEIARYLVNLKDNTTTVVVQAKVTSPLGEDVTEITVSIAEAKEWTNAELAARCADDIGKQKAQRDKAKATVTVTLPAVDATAVAAAAAAAMPAA